MKAQPEPMVSGRYFFPKAPLLWTKLIPAWTVISRNSMRCAEAEAANKSRKNVKSGLPIILRLPPRRLGEPSFAPSPRPLDDPRLTAQKRAREQPDARCCPRD